MPGLLKIKDLLEKFDKCDEKLTKDQKDKFNKDMEATMTAITPPNTRHAPAIVVSSGFPMRLLR